MFSHLVASLNFLSAEIALHLPFVIDILLVLFGFHCLNALLGYRLNVLGILPRTQSGLIGIIFSPLLHANFEHLLLNMLPLFILMCLVLVGGVTLFIKVTASIVLMSGVLVWLFGRKAIHIGASGLVMGYWSYVIFRAYHQGGMVFMLVALLCLYYLAGMIFNLLPTSRQTSWEGHVFGFLAGILTGYLF